MRGTDSQSMDDPDDLQTYITDRLNAECDRRFDEEFCCPECGGFSVHISHEPGCSQYRMPRSKGILNVAR